MYTTYHNKLKTILSNPKVTIIIIGLVILSRIIQLVYFYNIVVDASYQIIGAQSLLSGHGISFPTVLPDDLSQTIYSPLINWPPGYSLLLAPFYYLFSYNYIAAGLTLDILSAVILIFICRNILKVLDIQLYLRNIFTLLTGFFIYFFYFNACSDAIAITLILIAFYFTLVLLKTKKNLLRNTALLTAFLFAGAAIKYLFMPAAFVIPLFLFFTGWADGDKLKKRAGLYSFLILAIMVVLLLFYQKTISGSATYISSTGRGFFPKNLLETYPTFPASFLKPDTILLLINEKEETGKLVYSIYQGIYILILVFLIIVLIRQLVTRRFKKMTLIQNFFYISIFLFFSIIFLLAILSLVVEKEEIFPWLLWTYIQEARYHGLPNVLMHISVFAFYQYYKRNHTVFFKYSFYFFTLLMIPETMRGLNFNINRIRNFKKEEYSWQYESRVQQYADSIIKKEKSTSNIEKAIVTGTSYYMNHRVVINSHVPLFEDIYKVNDLSSLNTGQPVFLLVILDIKALPGFLPFLSRKEVKTVGNFDGLGFYIVHLSPN